MTGLIRQAPDELPEALEVVGDLNPAQRRKSVVDQFPPDVMAAGYETVYLRPATTEPKPSAASRLRPSSADATAASSGSCGHGSGGWHSNIKIVASSPTLLCRCSRMA
ncbi:hypothetical protein A6P39_008155 [Streptomyces sp. FXJ1.172]|uniref:hypothetical protein n=1 Tax=Streptomyces sp. FXJ1.172 TaxID=710705 RepID=UPI000AC496CB|nr:hypothetical protein [Streptomyces sp. FXJ1.172]WEP00505.1 hypothetical protein A6P39_008155 [Streptomyces sp. FXJ1.172]